MNKLDTIGESIFSRMTALAVQHQAINLAQGFPDFKTDPRLIQLVDQAMKDGYNQYARSMGIEPLHQAISQLVLSQYGVRINTANELLVVPGATFGIFATIQALAGPGDEVLIIEPAYDSYIPSILLAGAKPVIYQLRPPAFEIQWDEVNSMITPNTKVIILNNPNNPSSKVLTAEDFDALSRIISHTGITLISDEVYEFISFEQQHFSVLNHPELRLQSVVISSFGKSLHVTGWKCGYCIAPANITYQIRKINQYAMFSTNHAVQLGIAKYLGEYFDAEGVRQMYMAKRNKVKSAIEKTRFNPLPCQGTYFMLIDYSAISDLGSLDFAVWLTEVHGLATIPMDAFYSNGFDPKLIRLCFAKSDELLEESLLKLASI